MKAIAIVSGGMDSVTLAYYLKAQGYDLFLLSFDYGQRHVRELNYAALCAQALGAKYDVINLSGVRRLLGGSSLTDRSVPVPDGHYAAPTMRLTVVPNRNAIMLAVAFGAAVAQGADLVATAVHAGDHFIYPDCRPEFVAAFGAMQRLAVEGFGNPELRLEAPFVGMTKADIAALGHRLGVPFKNTWSCYKGAYRHCGKCGTCVERREAFALAGVADPTEYEEEGN